MISNDLTTTDLESLYRNNTSHPNPMFDFLTGFVPRRLRDLFVWMEYLYYNSAQIFAALKKFSEYPITDIKYPTTNSALEKRIKTLHKKQLKVKGLLIRCGLDRWIYGNSFTSVYQPFVRFLKCPECNKMTNIEHVNYRFKPKKLRFEFTCRKCKNTVDGKVIDRRLTNPHKIHVIRWDPKQMDIDFNPITGESIYYYSVPKDIKERVMKGNKHLLNTMPMSFLKAVQSGKMYRFAPGQIYHMKVDPPAGIDQQWGFPPLTSAIKLFFYAAVLRKANECVSLDTLIETSKGLIAADDVDVGDLVRTHTGSWQPVERKWYRTARENEVGRQITLTGLRQLSSVYSPQHPVFTLRRTDEARRSDTKDAQTSSVMLRNPHLYEEVLCPAEQLQVGHYVLYPRHLPCDEQIIDVAKYTGLYSDGEYVYNSMRPETIEAYNALQRGEHIEHNNAGRVAKRLIAAEQEPQRFPAQRLLTEDFAYLLGWYVGDGSANVRNLIFSLGADDDRGLAALTAAIQREFNLTLRPGTSKNGCCNHTLGHVVIRKLVKGLVPGTARHKKVPMEVLHGTDAIKIAFLRGLWDADGTHKSEEDAPRSTLVTTSKALSYDVYRMLLHLGCIATISEKPLKDSVLKSGRTIRAKGTSCAVAVCGPSALRLRALFQEGTAGDIESAGKSGFFWKDYFAARIHRITERVEPQYIDFKVAVDSTFCTAGTVTKNSIALDHIVPFRILHPAQTVASGDPIQQISLNTLFEEVRSGLRRWRRDPLTIMTAPVPVGMTQIGGDGRAMLTLGEVKEAEDGIIAAMGIPREFIYGGLSFTGSAITLRMLENQLLTYTGELNELLQWVTDRSCKILGWETTECELTEFKLIDDVQQKQLMLSLNQGGQQLISNTTIGELNDFDLKEERVKRKQEALDEVRFQHDVQVEVSKLQNSLAQQVQNQSMMGQQGLAYDQQQVISSADQLVQQLLSMDYSGRKSFLHSLQVEDFVMYSVVVQRLEEAQTQQQQQTKNGAK
jgi:hypothetical protein